MEEQTQKSKEKKIREKLEKQRKSIASYQIKLLTEQEEQRKGIANKIAEKYAKNNPVTARKNLNGLLTSISTTFSNFIGRQSSNGGKLKKRKTRRIIKNKKYKKTRKFHKIKRNKTIKKQRKIKHRKSKHRKIN
jgi:hypothetical protein